MNFFQILLQPVFRVLSLLSLPQFEMKLSLAIDRINDSNGLAGLDRVSGLHAHRLKLAIERIMITMVDHDALVIARHDHDLLHDTAEYGLDAFAL